MSDVNRGRQSHQEQAVEPGLLPGSERRVTSPPLMRARISRGSTPEVHCSAMPTLVISDADRREQNGSGGLTQPKLRVRAAFESPSQQVEGGANSQFWLRET